jgi:hypothetical protein
MSKEEGAAIKSYYNLEKVYTPLAHTQINNTKEFYNLYGVVIDATSVYANKQG